ncbi:spermine oxidase-like [Uranotaenia lowii]|uniref:spermine oxidase-like n=1 Tax=Uranotaenia lowii TaxID=190385 RepID=UPI00247B1BF8|nr:spermine oxidase-like [Uranotaenia lowii]
MKTKIIIIGAGAAGLAAGSRLLQNGVSDFVILEAGNRIGGRIWTVPFGTEKCPIELGAQWCHGEENNVVFELAFPLGLLEDSIFSHRNILIFSDGVLAPQDLTDKMKQLAEKLISSDETMKSKELLGDYFPRKFKQMVAETPALAEMDNDLLEAFITFYHNYLKGYLAIDSWSEVSASGDADYEECKGKLRMSWKGRGSSQILDLLVNSTNADADFLNEKIILNKQVTQIKYDQYPVRVECEDGSILEANHVLLTVSLGVLKHTYEEIFDPILPSWKIDAIEGLHFGLVNKAFLEFEQPFWLELANVFRLVWRRSDLVELQNLDLGWVEGVSTFFAVDSHPNVLGVWLVGSHGRHIESLPDEAVKKGLHLLLKRFFRNLNVPEPLNFIRSKWYSDSLVRGSYSSRSLKTEQLNTSAHDLSLPVADGQGTARILFAGEATSSNHWSTVHGAIESGWREADRLIQILK